MKVDLPALSLALQRASTGIKRTEDPSSGAVLLTASMGSLRASRSDGHHLSDGICPCEGDILVATDADRLKKLLLACTDPAAELSSTDNGDLSFKSKSVKAKLKGYGLDTLPRQYPPPDSHKLTLSAELADRIKWVEGLTRDKIDHNSKAIEKVIVFEIEDREARVFGRAGIGLAAWFTGTWADSNLWHFTINRELVTLIPAGPFDLVWTETRIAFDAGDSSTYEPQIECERDPKGRCWKMLADSPKEGSGFDPKALAGAISGALAVYSPGALQHRSIVLEAKNSTLLVSQASWAGDYEAEVQLFGDSHFKSRFNADLLAKVVASFKRPTMTVKDNTLWMWEGQSKVALQGMRL